jgi:predicted dehydrogenase
MSHKARIAVVGAGWWACEYHIPHVLANPDAELVGISRLGSEELQRIQERFGIPFGTEDHTKLYHQSLDGVIVASPHVLHAEHASHALRQGCHVLVEKPMATRTEEARLLQALVQESGKALMTPYGLNHTHYMEAAADQVHSGRIGEIQHAVLHMSSALMDLFGGEPMLETQDHMYRPLASTWSDPQRAGGYGWGQMSHALAALFFVAPLEPQSVHAHTVRSSTGADYFDAAVVRFQNGASATLSGAAGLPKHAPPQLDLKLYGTEGMLLLDVEPERERLQVRRFDEDDSFVTIERNGGFGSYSTQESVNRFINLCLGQPARNCGDVHVGAQTVRVLEALYASAHAGETIVCL